MREIEIGTGQATKYVRMLIGGKVSSGKTSFAATAPAPLFMADVAEGGFQTLETMDPRLWWDPAVKPKVWAMESMLDYMTYLGKLTELAASGKMPYRTLIFDSISVYARRVLRELQDKDPGGDGRQRYGSLEYAISTLIDRIHRLPMHVIWLCHTTDDDQLAVPGKATHASWANMGYKWLIRVELADGKQNYQLHTKPFRKATWIGGRSPVTHDPIIPSFKAAAQILKLPDRPVSPSCPPYLGQQYWNGVAY